MRICHSAKVINFTLTVPLRGHLGGSLLLADKAYNADAIRIFACSDGEWANIPPCRTGRDPICFSSFPYRERNRVKRFFNRIKQCPRFATRYDKLAEHFRAVIKLVAIRLWVKFNESTA